MNKGELINKLAEDAEITKTKAATVVNALLDTVAETLKNGEKVTLIGFGTFYPHARKAGKARDPRSGKEIDVPAKTIAKFKAGAKLAETVNS